MQFPTTSELEEMSKSSLAFRNSLSKDSFLHFFAYYYGHYINSGFAPFHLDMSQDLMDLASGKLSEVAEVTYRGSAKTSLAKAFITWCVVFHKYEYINVDSYDVSNAERILFDVVLELQTNRKLISDFGQLFNAPKRTDQKQAKRVKDFVCSNGVRVEAHSTQEPVRGRLHNAYRPQLLIFDDIETRKTMVSEAATKQVREHINEAKPGMDPKRNSILWLGNYISEMGNIQLLIDRLALNPKAVVRVIPLVEDTEPTWKENGPEWSRLGGRTTWPARFCLTDKEAEINPDLVSLQQMRRDMWNPDTGEAEFLLEMMCRPSAYSNRSFHRNMFTAIKFDEIKRRHPRVFFTVDSGGSADDDDLSGKDRCGFALNFVEHDGHWNLKAWGERLGPTALTSRIIDIMDWLIDEGMPCFRFGWEKNQFTNGMKGQFQEVQRRRKRMFPIVEFKHTIKKEDRIKSSLLHRYESGMIRHIEGECSDLEHELLMFPDAKNDDVVDAVAMMSELVPVTSNVRAKSNNEPVSRYVR